MASAMMVDDPLSESGDGDVNGHVGIATLFILREHEVLKRELDVSSGWWCNDGAVNNDQVA
jgi:hypothetical protein